MSAITLGHPGATTKQPVPVIRLGNGRCLTLGEYAKVWGYVKEAADKGMPTQRCDLSHPFDCRNEQATIVALEQFRCGMHDRINRRGGGRVIGRKTDPDWQFAAMRVAMFVNGDPRRTYHPNEWLWVPRELRRALRKREAAYG